MPTFKKVFSAIWYAWNLRNLGQVLFVFVGGLFFLFGAAYYGTRDRLPTRPEDIDLAAAHELVAGSTPRYVRLSAEPDFSKKIYRTGAWAPFWGNCPPDEIHEIDADDDGMDDLRDLLGCAVTLSGRLDIGEARTVRWPQYSAEGDIRTVALAPVTGTDQGLWVRSEVVSGAAIDLLSWQAETTFSGILATYDQALAGLPAGLSEYARQVLPARPEALVVFPDEPYTGESLAYFIRHIWVPVKGSDRVFYHTTTDRETDPGHTITGVLVPLALTDYQARNRSYDHFATVTGHPLPERIGVIEYPTAQAYNDRLSGYSGIFMIFGAMWTMFGLIGIALYIVAPGLIFNAWKRSWHQLKSGRPSSEEKPAPPASPEPPDYHPLMAPFSSLEPIPEDRAPKPDMRAAFKALWSVDPSEKDLYLAFIQDFSHPDNPDSGLRLISLDPDITVPENELINSGQRYPGLAIHLLNIRKAPLGGVNEARPKTPAAFGLRAGDYVVLCHAAAPRLLQRVVITAVFDGTRDLAREAAESALKTQPLFSLMGRIFLIGDSENGPCQALIKTADSSLLKRP